MAACVKIMEEYNEAHPETIEGSRTTRVTSAQCSRVGFKTSDVPKAADEEPPEGQAYCLVEKRDEAGKLVSQEYAPCKLEWCQKAIS